MNCWWWAPAWYSKSIAPMGEMGWYIEQRLDSVSGWNFGVWSLFQRIKYVFFSDFKMVGLMNHVPSSFSIIHNPRFLDFHDHFFPSHSSLTNIGLNLHATWRCKSRNFGEKLAAIGRHRVGKRNPKESVPEYLNKHPTLQTRLDMVDIIWNIWISVFSMTLICWLFGIPMFSGEIHVFVGKTMLNPNVFCPTSIWPLAATRLAAIRCG